MSDTVKFKGTVVRCEPDGFGIVEFDAPLGDKTHGVFSTVVSSTLPPKGLRRGAHVSGFAEVDNNDVAAVKTLEISAGG